MSSHLPAKIMDGVWFTLALIYLFIWMKFVKEKPLNIDFTEVYENPI